MFFLWHLYDLILQKVKPTLFIDNFEKNKGKSRVLSYKTLSKKSWEYKHNKLKPDLSVDFKQNYANRKTI